MFGAWKVKQMEQMEKTDIRLSTTLSLAEALRQASNLGNSPGDWCASRSTRRKPQMKVVPSVQDCSSKRISQLYTRRDVSGRSGSVSLEKPARECATAILGNSAL
jgi:hypothetical protein